MKLMNVLKSVVWSSAVALGVGLTTMSAQAALTVIPTSPGFVASTNENSTKVLIDWLANTYGLTQELYKMNVGGGSDTGGFAGSYQTTFSNSANDPQDAFIDYISGPALNCAGGSTSCYLLVKDGSQVPAAYLFNLAGLWNGTEDLFLTGFWPGNGAISHIAFYGRGGSCPAGQNCTPEIPEPGSLALVGLALFGLGVVRRRRSQ